MKYLMIILSCIVIAYSATTAIADTGTVTGRLVLENSLPLSDGQVYFFDVKSELEKPVVGKYWRVPDAVGRVDNDGQFTIQLNVGSYYMGAIKRLDAGRLGPPQLGDYFLPTHDVRGVYRTITVKKNVTTKLGTIKGIERYGSHPPSFKGKPTVIEGRIIMPSGQPVPNLYVLAYTDAAMQGHPSFVSTATNSEGHYQLYVDKGRTFYLKVRGTYAGGRPHPGELVGVFGSMDEPAPVEAATSSVTTGIDIQVDAFQGGRQ